MVGVGEVLVIREELKGVSNPIELVERPIPTSPVVVVEVVGVATVEFSEVPPDVTRGIRGKAVIDGVSADEEDVE
jgi:hypothetical protein